MRLFHLAAAANITLKAVYIPTKLNTTADLLSRHVFAASQGHYTITATTFMAWGGFRCNTIAFADV